ncbi:LysR substrate-binding domain-containing protein [Streptomyces sp. L7]|uniref:LysR substrate-binding domain-containing protein n=1 Tax=Streptomyces sp. L7 TaxID=3423954 RepID=UPI003D965B02
MLEPEGTVSRTWAVQLCRAAGFEPDVRFETADLVTHIRLVASGNAVGLLPDLVWAGARPEVALLPSPGRPGAPSSRRRGGRRRRPPAWWPRAGLWPRRCRRSTRPSRVPVKQFPQRRPRRGDRRDQAVAPRMAAATSIE